MKVKEEFDLAGLEGYGFSKVNKEEELEKENYVESQFDWIYNVGHSRRGQFYYILIDSVSRVLCLYASKPDGDGGIVKMPDVLLTLALDGVIETN